MFIKKSLFLKSFDFNNFPYSSKLPEIFLIGRSNVGKSTFVNILTNKKKICFVSKKPGKTIYLNYFLLNDAFYVIDSPGYGFSKRSKNKNINVFSMINSFFKKKSFNKIIFQLMDFKVGPTFLDLQVYRELIKNKENSCVFIIFNKKDKVSNNQILNQKKKIDKKLLLLNFCFIPKYFLLSCKNKEGIENIINLIKSRISFIS
ncbi:ribosome biogenesis GTP-binding protein YihA/YsxC [Candidatus Phytoplasma sacchari]|uniref:Probable GTP-binding protein EngB n=1 Tax=Candidatus Phytoplasma sacchari TaxID=2609813 RepID=A0ABY7M222_9MOLU|nr:ribosome biogenesis GTP-binding protein YihA/YsxC [Candidatus Phytoplasma sacchari]